MKVSHNTSRTQGSASHNDRQFNLNKAPHIDQRRLNDNHYWNIYEGMTFADSEKRYYQEHYSEMAEELYKKRADKMTTQDYLKSTRYCPEELILQIGRQEDNFNDRELFDECFSEYLDTLTEWNQEHGNHMHILNYAIHADEVNIHAHIRRVWDYQDEKGITKIGVERALKQAGILPQNPEQEISRYNNPKRTFDTMMYQKWVTICEEHGITVDKTPRKERHKRIDIYQRDKEIDRIREMQKDIQDLTGIYNAAFENINRGPHETDEKTAIESGDNIILTPEEFQFLDGAARVAVQNRKQTKELDEQTSKDQDYLNHLLSQKDQVKRELEEINAEIAGILQSLRELDPELPDVVMNTGKYAAEQTTDLER